MLMLSPVFVEVIKSKAKSGKIYETFLVRESIRTPGVPVSTPQFAGVASTSATAGAISTAAVTAGRYPRALDVTVPATPVLTIVLVDASFGYSFASGVPLYFMGDEIQRPVISWDGSIA